MFSLTPKQQIRNPTGRVALEACGRKKTHWDESLPKRRTDIQTANQKPNRKSCPRNKLQDLTQKQVLNSAKPKQQDLTQKEDSLRTCQSWSGLAVWVLNLWLGIGLPVEWYFHNESFFLGQVLLFGFWIYCWALFYLLRGMFIMRLLSGSVLVACGQFLKHVILTVVGNV